MRGDLQFDFLVDKEKCRMTIVREFAAERSVVWNCYTKSELLDRWFAPKPLVTHTKHMDFRESGYWHYVMVDPQGQEYWGRMDYKNISPNCNYTALDGFCDETGAVNIDLPRSHWDVTFTDSGKHSVVHTVVSYASAEELEKVMEMGIEEGMVSTLARLDELLSVLSEPVSQ